jgi:PAS domain S-box-containing protein
LSVFFVERRRENTDTKSVDASLKELEKILSVIATPVALVDLVSERILFLNQAAEVLIGYELKNEELLLARLFSDRSLRVVSAFMELARTLEAGFSIRENEIEVRRKTGRICPVNLSGSPMLWSGRSFLVVTMEDLSEIKKSEKERQALMEKAAHDSKLVDIGRLAAGMAHELNNPLAILLGYSENIEAWVHGDETDRDLLQKSVVPMRKSVLRMSKIVSKMMTNIRGQRTKMETHSLKKVAHETLIILEDLIASQSVELILETEELYVNCDSSQIEQIVTNIVMNALHALGNRKEGRQIRLHSYEKGTMHVLEIWNNGTPIPANIQTQIFTPFFTTKNTGEGTGLGLYMSFNIMKAHSGVLSFKSDEQGTAFYLSFPRVEKPARPARSPHLQVLIVDHDVFFRKSVEQKLLESQVECSYAQDGEDALAILIQAKDVFDLVLFSDDAATMPGLEFFSKIKSKCPRTRFALISSTEISQEKRQALAALQIDDILLKPLSSQELNDLVAKLGQKEPVREDPA